MKPVLSAAESARLDRESPVPVAALMARAGDAVALEAVRMGAGYGTRVAVLAGPGNNGGDGYVAAERLSRRGVAVEVYALAEPRTVVARAARESAARTGVPVRALEKPRRPPDLIIDALFGGGFKGGVPGGIMPWLDLDVPVLAVDIPSGVAPDSGVVEGRAVVARRTVSFHTLKPGHLLGAGPDHSGRVVTVDIGLVGGEPDLLVLEASDAYRPDRSRTAHKWSAGGVLVVGGSRGMVGAAVMAGRSALHFGAGSVGVTSPCIDAVQVLAPEVLAYPADTFPERYAVVVLGPGMGEAPSTVDAALRSGRSLVVDADALGQLPADHRFDSPTVLTPHAGEFARLTDEAPGPQSARRLAARFGAVVVLKGNPTVVTDGGVPRVVVTGGPELATIGTGDVLSGMIAALMARGLDPLDAACSAAHWHGEAGAALASSTTVTADALSTHIGRYAWDVR